MNISKINGKESGDVSGESGDEARTNRPNVSENIRMDGGELAKQVADLLEKCKKLQDAASSHSSRVRSEAQALSHQAVALDSDVNRLRKDLILCLEKDEITQELAEKVEDGWYRARGLIREGDVAALLPHKSYGMFLRFFLGPVDVRANRNDVRLKVKEEYNAYRDRTAVLFLAFPCTLLLLKNLLWNGCIPALPVQIYQVWLLFFYTSLALRENILRVNGSDIRPWWVYHHYCAMVMSLVCLTWQIQGQPNCVEKQHGVRLFLGWAVMQGVLMLLQNRYQRQRLYTRIALGKAGRMDVVWGETAGVKGQLWVLYPLLFSLQAFEFFIGCRLLQNAIAENIFEWQRVVCGLLLLVMAVGNFVNTIKTFFAKSKVKTRMRKAKQAMQNDAFGNSRDTKAL